jgi:hypothetical protein
MNTSDKKKCEDVLDDLALEDRMRKYTKPGDPNSAANVTQDTGDDWQRALLECIW